MNLKRTPVACDTRAMAWMIEDVTVAASGVAREVLMP